MRGSSTPRTPTATSASRSVRYPSLPDRCPTSTRSPLCSPNAYLSVPRFRQVLRTQPLDLGAPQWVDDPNVDISHHVRRAALPRPGDDAALFRWVAEVMERRLDRDRPLWECWIVDRLQHNRWAILMKIHHCIADGIAATYMLARLCDDGGAGTFATRSVPPTNQHGVARDCRHSRSIPLIGSPEPGVHRWA